MACGYSNTSSPSSNPSLGIKTWRIFGSRIAAFPSPFRGIIDVLAARQCAWALRIAVRGTLGLTLIAKQRGHIPPARRVLEPLRQSGMYLSDKVMNKALAPVSE